MSIRFRLFECIEYGDRIFGKNTFPYLEKDISEAIFEKASSVLVAERIDH